MQMRTWVSLLIQMKRAIGVISGFVLLVLLPAQNVLALPGSSEILPGTLSAEHLLVLKTAQQKIFDKDYQQALNLSERILTKLPAQFEAQFIRAQALSRLGKTEEAIELYKSILKSNLVQPEVYNNLATLYARQGNLDLARQTLDKGMATNAQYKTLYDNLSAIYVEMARGAYSKALKLGVQAKAVQLKTLNVAFQPPRYKQDSNTVVASAETGTEKKTRQAKVSASKKPTLKDLAPKEPATKLVAVVKPAAVVKKEFVNKQTAVNINKDEVITALQGWAAAWSAQAVDLYLSFYGKDFTPVKLSKKVWAVQRRIRIRKPNWVNVRLNNFKVKAQQKDKAIVQLVQDYRADNYRDKTKKQFVMQRTVDGWRILSEKSLAVIR